MSENVKHPTKEDIESFDKRVERMRKKTDFKALDERFDKLEIPNPPVSDKEISKMEDFYEDEYMKSEEKMEKDFQKMDKEKYVREAKEHEKRIAERKKREKIEQEEAAKLEAIVSKKLTRPEERKLEKGAEEIKKLYAFDCWMTCFNQVSFCNEITGQALFHVCLGQALNTFTINVKGDSKIDWRLHYLLIQDSRSGKGKALQFVDKVFKDPRFMKLEIGMMDNMTKRPYKTYKLGRMNPAALINSYKTDHKGTIRKDVTGNEIINYGPMQEFDFIYAEEARAILSYNNTGAELQEIFMTAMETIGSSNNVYTKNLMNYEKVCPTTCTASFVFTTRPLGKMKNTLIQSGLIQRCMFFPREMSQKEEQYMNTKSASKYTTYKNKSTFNENYNLLITKLNEAVKFGWNNNIDFDEKNMDKVSAFIFEKLHYWSTDVDNKKYDSTNKQIMRTFVRGYPDNMVIMAFHSAVLRHSKKVERVDLQYAFEFFDKLFKAQKLWLDLTIEEDQIVKKEDEELRKELIDILKNDVNDLLTLPDVINKMSKIFKKEYCTMRYHVMKFNTGDFAIFDLIENKKDRRRQHIVLK